MPLTPTTLQQAIIHFANFENCKEFMTALRWTNGVPVCPVCGSKNLWWLDKRRVWKCKQKHARQTFSLKTGTILEDSPIPLEKWLPAMWMLANCKNGVSSWEIHRALEVTQKTAWFMLQRLRLALQDDMGGGKLGGTVEVDETFIGGKARNMHKARRERALGMKGGGYSGKIGVQGMLQRGGKIKAVVVDNTKLVTLIPNVKANVESGSTVCTDELPAYFCLQADYEHKVVNHAIEYVLGNIHTNGVENFWSLLKRGLGGTYVSVEPFHLFRYVDEQAFRFNNRNLTDGLRFQFAIRHIVGRRLTYKQLTAKEEVPSSLDKDGESA
ncbi:MAG: IS1595 family transposase [Bryobacterales bacterium]|nr:IS1595 family transposase [Bryobacterales bacterium]